MSQYNQDFNEVASQERTEMSIEDKQFLEIAYGALLKDGHYSLNLPFRKPDVFMPNNRQVAEQRLQSLKRKMKRDEQYKQEYIAFLNDIFENNYAEEIPQENLAQPPGRVWYLPHHGVYHPKKKKLRVVFDCAASFHGVSLNTVLLQGPDLTNSLIGVILRFRKEPIGIMADVKSMFHQVRVSKSDVNYLRFLWWPQGDTSRTPREHRMLVHIFGAVSSPNVASFALQKTAADNEISFPPQVAETVRHNFYVDDCAKSVTKESDAIQLVKSHIPAEAYCLLSVLSLSFLAPLILPVKQLQQELCHRGFGWDKPLPQSVSDWWMDWTSSLEKIKSFSVPRCLKPHGYGVMRCAELHHFSDASESGYGSVSYIRQVNEQDVVHVTFVLGKSRVPPLKAITIPRLELAATALLVKVDRMLRRELHVDLKASVFWTDSQTVLKNIANDSARFKT
ncbi:hypothetical protein SRHO_G00032460 [Serrasalmus rhombeus]